MSAPLLTREGPGQDELRIIGVELAATQQGCREVELQMFACSHTMPLPQWYGSTAVRVTLHTSRGDVTLTGVL